MTNEIDLKKDDKNAVAVAALALFGILIGLPAAILAVITITGAITQYIFNVIIAPGFHVHKISLALAIGLTLFIDWLIYPAQIKEWNNKKTWYTAIGAHIVFLVTSLLTAWILSWFIK